MFRINYKGMTGKQMMKLEGDFRRMTTQGADAIGQKLQGYLVNNALMYNLYWKGNLTESIEVRRINRTQLVVDMAFYSWMLEHGHYIPPGVKLPLLIGWARERMGIVEGNKWIKKVFREGHQVWQKPFISDSIDAIRPQIRLIMAEHLKKR